MARRSRSFHSLFLSLVLASAACGGGREAVRYEDFIVSGRVSSTAEAKRPQERTCGDETHVVLPLGSDEELSVATRVGKRPTVVLSGCGSHTARRDTAELHFTAESLQGERARRVVELPSSHRWWREEIALGELTGGLSRLRLRVEGAPGARFYLKDFYLEHVSRVPPGVRSARQVLLISVDTLREDALSTLGGTVETPALDRFVQEAQVWSPHYAAATGTKASHASLLTGHYPDFHGADDAESPIRSAVPSLVQRFRAAGFLTAGLVSDCVWLSPGFGFARGFDVYRVVPWRLSPMVREIGNWIAGHRDQQFFFFFHTFELYPDFEVLPYEAPGVSRETIEEQLGVSDYGCTTGEDRICGAERLRQINNGSRQPHEREEEVLRYLYGRSVQHLDEELGFLFERLRELGIFDGMMIILTSDHGEQFFEHGQLFHAGWWEEVLRVPLIIKWPGGRFGGESRDVPSSAIDVAPTLLEAFGLRHDDLPGTPLAERSPEQSVVAGTSWRAIVSGDLKGVFHWRAGIEKLYDLAAEPAENRDLSAERRDDLERLRQSLRRQMARAQRLHRERGPASPTKAKGNLNSAERTRLQRLAAVEEGGRQRE